MEMEYDYLNAVGALEKADGVIAFPTDTVYGLGCLPEHAPAVEKIYRMKGRSFSKPLILMGANGDDLAPYLGEMSLMQAATFQRLVKDYWPGALTLVVPKSDRVPRSINREVQTIGLRIPNCPFLLEFFQVVPKGVLATTSANPSEHADSTTAAEVFSAFHHQVDFILTQDGIGGGRASTVAAVKADGTVTVLRQGSVMVD